MYESRLHTWMYTTYVPGVHRGQKKTSDALELKLWVTVRHGEGPGN